MRDRKVLFISTKFQKPRQSSIVAASHIYLGGQNCPEARITPPYPTFHIIWNCLSKMSNIFEIIVKTTQPKTLYTIIPLKNSTFSKLKHQTGLFTDDVNFASTFEWQRNSNKKYLFIFENYQSTSNTSCFLADKCKLSFILVCFHI